MLATVLGAFLVSRSDWQEIPEKVLKFYWFLANNSVCFACALSLAYWTILYQGTEMDLNDCLVHATNSLVLIVDLLIVRHPHRMSHFIYPMAIGSLYVCFTIVYQLLGGVDRTGGNFVYSVLDWKNKPEMSAVVGVGCVLCVSIAHVIVGGVHRMRTAIHRRLYPKPSNGDQTVCTQNLE
jgi:hypothetical protein